MFYVTEGENEFVEVEYKSSERRFICSFLNQPESDTAPLSCVISYTYIDGTDDPVMLTGNTTNDPTRIRIDLDDDELEGEYSYTITASDGIHIVAVEGVFTIGIVKILPGQCGCFEIDKKTVIE